MGFRLISHRMVAAGFMAGCLSACFTAPFNPQTDNVFACESAEDCQEDQFCVRSLCRNTAPPRLQISTPEDETRVVLADLENPQADFIKQQVAVFTIGGTTLTLVNPEDNPKLVVGEGHLVVFVDGELAENPIIQGELISNGVSVDVNVSTKPGPHRIAVIARTSDGQNYGTDGSIVEHILWMDDGKPHVAIKSPTQFQPVPPIFTKVDVTASAINFTFKPSSGDPEVNFGHIHIYHNKKFPQCLEQPGCDTAPTMLLPTEQTTTPLTGPMNLPKLTSGTSTLTAVLRNNDHTPFFVEDTGDTDTDSGTATNGELVIDEVTLLRDPAN